MIVAAVLIGWAALLVVIGPLLLQGAGWTGRSPRLAIALWQAMSVSALVSVVLAGLALAAPADPFGTDLAAMARACLMALRRGYATPGGIWAGLAGLVLAAGVTTRSAGCLVAGLVRSARQRRVHADTLDLIGQIHGPCPGTFVIDHAIPAAYCLPGRHRRVVLTSAALAALDPAQLDAVLVHEHAHLSGRHHLVVGVADAWRRAFPGIPLFRQAHGEITRLVELAADDVATRRHGRLAVAAAMAVIAGAKAPASALAAGGTSTLERVRRLLRPARPLPAATRLAGFAMVAALVTSPALAAAPALDAVTMGRCTPAMTAMSPACQRFMGQSRANLSSRSFPQPR